MHLPDDERITPKSVVAALRGPSAQAPNWHSRLGPLRPWRTLPARLHALRADVRGAQMVEYTVIIGGVAMTCMLVFVTLGVAIAQSFAFARSSLFYPYP